jgi:uncharacterized protein YeaO (DUF488 family)
MEGASAEAAMIKVKHLMDAVESDDGVRMWVEPVGLTTDLRQWCRVDHVLPHLGPPAELARWFEDHPDAWDFFRAKYHEFLGRSSFRAALAQLARVARQQNITLLHHGDNPAQNTAVALQEFISELSAYSQPE